MSPERNQTQKGTQSSSGWHQTVRLEIITQLYAVPCVEGCSAWAYGEWGSCNESRKVFIISAAALMYKSLSITLIIIRITFMSITVYLYLKKITETSTWSTSNHRTCMVSILSITLTAFSRRPHPEHHVRSLGGVNILGAPWRTFLWKPVELYYWI